MNVGDPQDIARRTREARRAEAAKRSTLERVMSTYSGRWWIYTVLEQCHIYRNPFSVDALAMAFACGEMNIGQLLLIDLNQYCQGRYAEMLAEANDRSSIRDSDDAASRDSGEPGSAGSGDDDTWDPNGPD